MSTLSGGPNIVTNGLVIYLDANNEKSVNFYNLLERTEKFNTSPWIKLGSPNVTITENVGIAPNGTLTASRMISNSNNQFGIRQSVGIKIEKTKTYTFSVWLKSSEPIQIRVDISDISPASFNVTTEWVRYQTTTVGNITYSDSLQFVDIVFDSNLINKEVFIWGAQLVEGTEVLNYQPVDIPTINDISNNNGIRLLNGTGIRSRSSIGSGRFEFDGVDDYIDITTTPNLTNPLTICAFVNTSLVTSSNQVIYGPFANGQDNWLSISDNKVQIFATQTSDVNNFSITGTTTIQANTWYHITGIVNNNVLQIYINGIFEAISTTQAFTVGGWNSTARIGQRATGQFPFNGRIAYMQGYNRALSAQEVLQNYNSTKSRFGL
jgi:hypothetical protein